MFYRISCQKINITNFSRKDLSSSNQNLTMWFLTCIRVIRKVTLSSQCLEAAFTPSPLFQWCMQSKEILLNLGMKCWVSAFNAQGSRLIIVVVQLGAVKIYVAAMEERQDETQFTTKIGEKSSLAPTYFACEIFIPSYAIILLCQNWPFSPPNRRTLWLTLSLMGLAL
jgi:hypothetical protein